MIASPSEWNWVDLSPYWDQLKQVAKERDDQKRQFQSSRYMNADSHFVGLAGEKIHNLEKGTPIDLDLKISGDGGKDTVDPRFGDLEIKTSTFIKDPDLKHPVNAKHWPKTFALVVLDIEKKRGALLGYATLDQLKQKQKNYGYGQQYYMNWRELSANGPEPKIRQQEARSQTAEDPC